MELKGTGIRPTKQGSYEVTISHRSLPTGRVTRNFDTPEEAWAYKQRRLGELHQGIVLPELKKAPLASPQLSQVLRAYLNSDTAKIAKTDRPVVEVLQERLTGTLAGMTTTWVDAWVRKMKREDQLAPGTIRKKVEALARAVDWWNRKEHQDAPNPLRTLPRGYSTYADDDLKPGQERPQDTKRDRRLHPGEYEDIEAVIQGVKRPDRERAWGSDDRRDMLMLFRLIVHTGLRLREAYTLLDQDVKFDLHTIHVRRSKTGATRDVPMTRQLESWLKDYIKATAVRRAGAGGIVFPYWAGSYDEDVLRSASSRLSVRFSSLFDYAGCENLTEHDLRHEATCRWMDLKGKGGQWLFRPEEVRRITGHKSVQMFERYLSMRGSDLAERLR